MNWKLRKVLEPHLRGSKLPLPFILPHLFAFILVTFIFLAPSFRIKTVKGFTCIFMASSPPNYLSFPLAAPVGRLARKYFAKCVLAMQRALLQTQACFPFDFI